MCSVWGKKPECLQVTPPSQAPVDVPVEPGQASAENSRVTQGGLRSSNGQHLLEMGRLLFGVLSFVPFHENAFSREVCGLRRD
jgi:hypothetical protein